MYLCLRINFLSHLFINVLIIVALLVLKTLNNTMFYLTFIFEKMFKN